MRDWAQIKKEAAENADRTRKRMTECEMRRGVGCGLMDRALGWTHALSLPKCDQCFALGGVEGGKGLRDQWVKDIVSKVLSSPSSYEPDVITAVALKHSTPEGARALVVSQATRLGEEKAPLVALTVGGQALKEEVEQSFARLTPSQKIELKSPRTRWDKVKETWDKASSFLKSELSLHTGTLSPDDRRIREISCFGVSPEGVRMGPACPSLRPTQDGKDHFCNDCGCGERNKAIIRKGTPSKLDYPYLECPRGRPGFSNSVEDTPPQWRERELDLSRYFDRVVCINMDRREDRWKKFQEGIPRDWPLAKIQRVRGVDGKMVPAPLNWGWGGGTWGCARSHVRVLEDAILDKVDTLLVLEDDAAFVPDFAKRLREFLSKVPAEWDSLMLGGQHLKAPIVFGNGIVQCANTQRTHGYAVRGEFIKSLYREWVSKGGHVDHIMGPMHSHSRVYAPSEMLILQGADHSDICNRTFTEDRSWDWQDVVMADKDGRPPGWFSDQEGKFYQETVKGLSKVVEVGSWMGRPTTYALEGMDPKAKISCIDTWKGGPGWEAEGEVAYAQFRQHMEKRGLMGRINPLTGWDKASLFPDDSLEVVFLDHPDHSQKAVEGELDRWWPKLKKGGHLLIHDYADRWPGVKKPIDKRFPQKEVVGWLVRIKK